MPSLPYQSGYQSEVEELSQPQEAMANNVTIVSMSQSSIPLFKGVGYDSWSKKMKTFFRSQDLWDLVKKSYDENEISITNLKDAIKKDCKSLLFFLSSKLWSPSFHEFQQPQNQKMHGMHCKTHIKEVLKYWQSNSPLRKEDIEQCPLHRINKNNLASTLRLFIAYREREREDGGENNLVFDEDDVLWRWGMGKEVETNKDEGLQTWFTWQFKARMLLGFPVVK